jgi:hypothetical protein
MTKFNSEKYEQFLEAENTLSGVGFIEIFDERVARDRPDIALDQGIARGREGNLGSLWIRDNQRLREYSQG